MTSMYSSMAAGERVSMAARTQALIVPVGTILLLVWQLIMPLAPDVAWLVTVSERMLDGQQLYSEIFETNPPMAGLLYMLPVLLGRLLGVSPDPLITVQTVAFALLGTGLAAHLVTRYRLLSRPEMFLPVAWLLGAASWGIEFGQREQYALLAVLPVLVAIAARMNGARLGWRMVLILALLGGVSAAIKPHFVLPLLVPAVGAAFYSRSLRPLFAPELVLSAVVFLGFWLWTGLTLPAYFSIMLPELAAAYLVDRRPLWQMMINLPTFAFFAFAIVGALLYPRQIAGRPLLAILALGGCAYFVVFVLQGKGFFYHSIPAFVLMAIAVLGAFDERQGAGSRPFDQLLPILICAVFVILPQHYVVRVADSRTPLIEAIEPYGPGLAIANITHEIRAAEPLTRIVGGHYVNSMPALINTLSSLRLRIDGVSDPAILARAAAAEEVDRVRLREDFKRQPPDIVVTSRDGVDWIEWAARDPELAAILSPYTELTLVPFGDFELLLLKRPGLEPVQR